MTKKEIIESLDNSTSILSKEGMAEEDRDKLMLAAICTSLSLQLSAGASDNLQSIAQFCLTLNEDVTKETREQHEKIVKSWGIQNKTVH